MRRVMGVWCPDWPVLAASNAAGIPADKPVAVVGKGKVIGGNHVARAAGVRRGQRLRQAQAFCPELLVEPHEPTRDARLFEPVVVAIENLMAGVQVLRPGLCVSYAQGAARYFGGEDPLAELVLDAVAKAGAEGQIGVADGCFPATIAARMGTIVAPGQSPEFLAALDISLLELPAITSVLRRLGINTIGAFTSLPIAEVANRFGKHAARLHRIATGAGEELLAPRNHPPELTVVREFDPPLCQVDAAVTAAMGVAEAFQHTLAVQQLACTQLVISAKTAGGAEFTRVWRHEGLLDSVAITDRVRWQLESWPLAEGIRVLTLAPDGVTEHHGWQTGLWGELGAADELAHSTLSRLRGVLGPDGIGTAVLHGSRTLADAVKWAPWGEVRAEAAVELPWPGQLPPPWPATVFDIPIPARVYDASGAQLGVSGRYLLSAAPAWVEYDERQFSVASWAGPWPVEERWWGWEWQRYARLQVDTDGPPLLLSIRSGQWFVEAVYD